MNSRALVVATAVGTVLQLAMVIAGHSNKSIAALFAILGVSISLIAGIVYAVQSKGGSVASLALGGLAAGGLCALIGIIVSFLLGDVPASILLVGTCSSAVTGAIGGAAGKLFVRSAVVSVVAFALVGSPRHATAPTPTTLARATPAESVKDLEWPVGRSEGKMTKAPRVARGR
jgi:xanthine/uracil permease